MHLALITMGSRGDVQPYIALGVGLQRAGHQVTLVTHAAFQGMIAERGLGFALVSGDPQAILNSGGGDFLRRGNNPIRFIRGVKRAIEGLIPQIVEECLQAATMADAILYAPVGSVLSISVAERLRMPSLPAFYLPLSPTAAFPHPLLTTRLGGRLTNRLTHFGMEHLLWQVRRRTINTVRRTMLDLTPLPFSGPDRLARLARRPNLYGFSRHVLPRPADWGSHLHITGYWFLDHPADWQPPTSLMDFLASGPPPLCVGFGSLPSTDPAATTARVVQALQRSRQRAILITAWGGLAAGKLPDDIFAIESVPFDWLFPRVAAVVHHGGAGTTAAGLRAGVPAVVVPHIWDQSFWGHQLQRLGVAPAPIPHRHLSVEQLTAAIQRVTGDPRMRERAERLGEAIRAEDGVAVAADLVDRYLGPRAEGSAHSPFWHVRGLPKQRPTFLDRAT